MGHMYNLITNIFEPMIDLYIIKRCIGQENKNSRFIFIVVYIIDILILFFDIPLYAQEDYIIRRIFIVIPAFALYKEKNFEIFTSANIVNIMWGIIFIFMSIVENKINNFIILVSLKLLIMFLIIKYTYRIVRFYKFIKLYKYLPFYLIVIKLLCDIILKSYQEYEAENSLFFIGIILTGYLLFFTIGIIYFINTKNKSNTIINLANNLDMKNCELRKIKEEHENMIYYLHYLVSSGRDDEAAENMQNTIHYNSKNPQDIIEIGQYKNHVVAMTIKACSTDGVKIIVREDCELDGVMMPKMELYRVMVNIVNNAVKAMNGIGIIVMKIYKEIDEAVIIIENNGPKISEVHMKEIFKAGFTTKDNEDKSHGFGLSIVKELIEKYNGTISVRSDDNSTEFEISLPFNKENNPKESLGTFLEC